MSALKGKSAVGTPGLAPSLGAAQAASRCAKTHVSLCDSRSIWKMCWLSTCRLTIPLSAISLVMAGIIDRGYRRGRGCHWSALRWVPCCRRAC
eukprot:7066891-Pyramimonas_sp.AAC.1